MRIRLLNCFTCAAYIPGRLQTGGAVLVIESNSGVILIDSGLGQQDYQTHPRALRDMKLVTRVPMDPEEAAVRQLTGLGFLPEDVTDIVLTHMHYDHCGGLADFPAARVHVSGKELDAFKNPGGHWLDRGYESRHIEHKPRFELYGEPDAEWKGFPAMRVRVNPEIYLIPLPGHTTGHCGVVLKTDSGWWLHAGDAAPASFDDSLPYFFTRIVLGPHIRRLFQFREANPDVRVTTGHMLLSEDAFDRWY